MVKRSKTQALYLEECPCAKVLKSVFRSPFTEKRSYCRYISCQPLSRMLATTYVRSFRRILRARAVGYRSGTFCSVLCRHSLRALRFKLNSDFCSSATSSVVAGAARYMYIRNIHIYVYISNNVHAIFKTESRQYKRLYGALLSKTRVYRWLGVRHLSASLRAPLREIYLFVSRS